jgi:hypothetical protein
LLLKNHLSQIERIAIDEEYPGQEAAIRSMLLNHIRKIAPGFREDQIVFHQIGKRSQAHYTALAVYRGSQQPGRKVKANELLRLIK